LGSDTSVGSLATVALDAVDVAVSVYVPVRAAEAVSVAVSVRVSVTLLE